MQEKEGDIIEERIHKSAERIFRQLYCDGFGETDAWNEAYKIAKIRYGRNEEE